jgi:hypothetical protein
LIPFTRLLKKFLRKNAEIFKNLYTEDQLTFFFKQVFELKKVINMKKSKMAGTFFLLGLMVSLGMGTATALTASGLWGMSEGDVLYYRVTTATTVIDSKVVVNDIYDGNYLIDYNFVNATTYVWNGVEWYESFAETQWAGINNTYGAWYGALAVLLGFPNPAPNGWSIESVNFTLNANLAYSSWGEVSSEIVDNTLTLTNATESIILTYDETNGVCLNNTRMKGDTFYNSQVYLGEVDPHAEPTGDDDGDDSIPGYNPVIFSAVLGLSYIFLAKKIKKEK